MARCRSVRALFLALAAALLPLAPARAALQKFRLETIDIASFPGGSPTGPPSFDRSRPGFLESEEGPPVAPFDEAVVQSAGTGGPVLRRLRLATQYSATVSSGVPPFSIFARDDVLEGPGPLRKPAAFTGTGSTAAGSTLRWGVVTGWTVTGALFTRCQFGFPSSEGSPWFCQWFDREHETSIDPPFRSSFYDLGTWFFHATGFTATPFVHEYWNDAESVFDLGFGNEQRWLRGFRVVDAAVPALPLAGLLLLAASLEWGASSLGRRR